MGKSRFIKAFMAVAMLAMPYFICAQEEAEKAKENQIDINLHVLTQGEIRNGGLIDVNSDDPNAEDRANFILERARLIIGYQRERLEMKLTPQHVGIWGQGGKGSFNIYEVWAKYTTKPGLFGQIGRQVLSYDDERILGPDDWAMTELTHDLLKLGYEGHGHKVHALLAYNQNPENVSGGSFYVNGSQSYKTMQTLWYHYDIPKTNLGASLLMMNLGVQGGIEVGEKRTWYQQLAGTHITYRPKWGSFSASFYHQLGKEEHGMEITGWMTAVRGKVIPSEIFSITAGYDYLSGDKYFAVPKPGQTGLVFHDKFRGFCSLYGSHHKFYGAMDFFYVSTYVNGFSPGLQNTYLGTDVTPVKGLSIGAYYHYMATATKLKNINKTLGHAIELSASYKYKDYMEFSAGFSYMTGTETMEKLKRASNDGSLRWGWLRINITPKILSYKW